MHIKPLDATICYAQALFRPTIGLQLGLPSLQPRHTKVDNSISAYWSGRYFNFFCPLRFLSAYCVR